MGEAADDCISGLMCECCGEFLDGDAPGYPRKCTGCAPEPLSDAIIKVHDRERSKMIQKLLKVDPTGKKLANLVEKP